MYIYIFAYVYNWLLYMDIFNIGPLFIRINAAYIVFIFRHIHL